MHLLGTMMISVMLQKKVMVNIIMAEHLYQGCHLDW
jgi:hypothetical protein